jgi:hypothetical protein
MITEIKEGTDLTLRLESEGELYDVLEKRHLGRGSEIQIKAPGKGKSRFYARLPYRIAGLNVEFPEAIALGSAENLEVQEILSSDRHELDTHFLRVEVFDPGGELVDPLSGNHVAKNGRLDLLVDIPYNATLGEWTIRITDVVSNVEGKASFQVIK